MPFMLEILGKYKFHFYTVPLFHRVMNALPQGTAKAVYA